jgi:hypothetical protein
MFFYPGDIVIHPALQEVFAEATNYNGYFIFAHGFIPYRGSEFFRITLPVSDKTLASIRILISIANLNIKVLFAPAIKNNRGVLALQY